MRMRIRIIPCEGMTEGEAVYRASGIFAGQQVDYSTKQEGAVNGSVLTFQDNAVAFFYRTKAEYVVRFDSYGDEGGEKWCG